MKKFYFTGGPKKGAQEEFFRRLNEIGGSPAGWQVYPHENEDGQALHIIDANSEKEILQHLQHFEDIYSHGEIIEIITIVPNH